MNAAAAAFLASLAPGATGFTFQTFDDSSAKRPELTCVLHGTLEQHGTRLLELNKAGAGVFVVVNETDGTGRKAANVTRARALFADFDKADPSRPARLAADLLPPTLLVESSPSKHHAYWVIDGALPLEQFKPLQRAIAASLGSDTKVCDLPRVMRLPGFHHRKGEPHLGRLLPESSMRRYSPEQVCARFPVPEKPAKPEPAPLQPAGTLEDVSHIVEALRLLEPRVGDQGTWLTVMAALNYWERTTPGAEGMGYELAREWSALWDRFDANEFETRYHSFRNERDGAELVTLGSLFHLAAQCRDDDVAERFKAVIRLDFVPPAPAPVATLAPPPVGLVEVSLADVMTAPLEPVSFAVAPWLPRRHVTLLGGHGGMGKSSLALAIGAHVACGRPFASLDVERLPVLFVSLEDEPRTVRARLRRIIDAYRLPADDVLGAGGLRLLDGTQGFSALFAEDLSGRQVHTTAAYAQLAQQVQGARLLVIDNASDAYEANENNRQAVRGFIRALIEIARANDAAVVLLAHIDKNAARGAGHGNNYSGSTAWHNSARSRLALIERDGRIWLEHEKANLSRRAEPVAFSVVDGVLMPDAPGATGNRDAEDQAAILAALRAAAEAGEVIPDNQSTGQFSPANVLKAFPEFVAQFGTGRDGKDRASAAIVALKRAGLIRSEKYRSPDRREKARLVPAPLPHSNGPPPDT